MSYIPYATPLIFALILSGCSADNGTLNRAALASSYTDAVLQPTSTPSVIDISAPTDMPTTNPITTDGSDDANGEEGASTPVPATLSAVGESSEQANQVPAGLQVYRESYCGTCHELAVAQTAGTFGPAHDQAGTIAETRVQDADYTGTATTAAEYLRESLLDPGAYLVQGYEVTYMKKPPFTHLKDEEIEALVVFLLDQK